MTEQNTPRGRGMKIQLWIMLGMVVGSMVLGSMMMPRNEAQRQQLLGVLGTTNQGTLISPAVDMSALLPAFVEEAEWRVVVIAANGCQKVCQDMLQTTKAVHIRLGRDSQRIERILLTDGLDQQSTVDIEQQHPYLSIAPLPGVELSELLAATNAHWSLDVPRYLLVNPIGDAMLYYTADNQPSDLLEDLKHVLKYSTDR